MSLNAVRGGQVPLCTYFIDDPPFLGARTSLSECSLGFHLHGFGMRRWGRAKCSQEGADAVSAIPCSLCESTRHRVVSRFAGAYNFRACNVICRECGLLFRSHPWREEQVAEFQRKLSQYSGPDNDASARGREQALRQEQSARRRLRWVRAYVPAPARVLGVGAGSSIFAQAARIAGYDATGIDPEQPNTAASEMTGSPAGTALPTGTDPPDESFDVVALFSVLEQAPDLHEALGTVRQLLTPQGLLIVEVPDTMCMTGRPKDHFMPEHNWHFTNRTLGLLLAKEGLLPLDIIQRDTGEEHVLFAAARKDRVPHPGELCIKNPLEYQRVLAYLRDARRDSPLTPEALVRDTVSIVLGPWLGMRAFAALQSLRQGLVGCTGRLYRTAFG